MNRRIFLASAASASALSAAETRRIPDYRIVTKFKPATQSGMPGPYPGRVVTVHSPKCIDEATEKVDVPTVQTMIARGMTTLTGDKDPRDSWARFFNAQDFVGIKINCSGAPGAMSMPEVVAEITRNLRTVGVKPTNMVIHERGGGQILQAHYERFVPDGVRVESANTWLGYDPGVYVEANFFGEDDTRSYLLRMVTEQFTKIINVPNMKDHGASGVTGCLKNIAYGEFNNVARSHYKAQTETLSFIGTLANVEPLRSRTVLNIMDGLRGVWHAGPFSREKRYRFYPKQMKFGTDPVAIDRFLIDVIDNKRKQEGAIFGLGARHEILQHQVGRLAGEPQREPIYPGAGPHRIRVETRIGRIRYGPDPSHRDHRMSTRNSWTSGFWVACIVFAGAAANAAEGARIYVTSTASSLVNEGLAAAAPIGSEATAFQTVPNPGIRFQANEAQATTAPWIDSNAWRFRRGIQKANYTKLPAGSAPLAAAEAFTFHVDAILNPEQADVAELGKFLRFLKAQEQPPLPVMANIGLVDDRSPLMDEVLNMLTRRNLLYRVVPAPDRKLDITVQLGTKDFPKESAEDPSDFAARVRAKLGDDKRLVRLYGATTVIAHLTGDGKRARLFLLNYGRGRGQGGGGGGSAPGLRIRVLGRYRPSNFAAHGVAVDAKLTDIENPGNTTEFSVPTFPILAIVDLDLVK